MSDVSCGQLLSTVSVNIPEANPNLSCTASSANVNVNTTVSFAASGGSAPYSWTGGGFPTSGNGNNFSTVYPSAGNKTVQVTSGDGQTAQCGVVVNSSPSGQCFISGNFAINFLPAVWNGTNFSVTVSWTSTNSNQIKITQDGSASVVGSGTSGGTIRVDNLVPGSSHTFNMYDLACGMLLTSNTVIIPQAPSNNNPNPNPNPVPPVYNNPQVNNITVNSCVNYSCNYNYYSVNNTGSTINNPPVLFPSQPTIPNSDWVNNLTSFLSQNKGGFIPPMPWFPFNN
jgi:hypothetical protein